MPQRFPYVDVFSPPSDPAPLVEYLLKRDGRELEAAEVAQRFAWQDEDLVLPVERARQPGQRVHSHRVRLLACLHLLHHPLPPRG